MSKIPATPILLPWQVINGKEGIGGERSTFQANPVLFETLLKKTIQRAFLLMELENKFINVTLGGHHLSDRFQTTGCLA